MSKIWLTSDTHFGHDRDFIWKPRGFKSMQENNNIIVKNWNALVQPGDQVYHLGDVMLGDNLIGLSLLKSLKGDIHIIRGNHDTDARMDLYSSCHNVVELCDARWLKYHGYNFYLSHFPTLTANMDKNSDVKRHILNLFGHTHQQTNFYEDIPYMYHVGVDSHNCKPILLDDIIKEIEEKAKKENKNGKN